MSNELLELCKNINLYKIKVSKDQLSELISDQFILSNYPGTK